MWFIALYSNIGILKLLRGAQAIYFLLYLMHSLFGRLIPRVLPRFVLVRCRRLCQFRRRLPLEEWPHILWVLRGVGVHFDLHFVRGKRFTKLRILIEGNFCEITYILGGLAKNLQRQRRKNSHTVELYCRSTYLINPFFVKEVLIHFFRGRIVRIKIN